MPRFLRPLIQGRTYLETFDLLLDLVVGTLWFTVFTTLIATGTSLLITLVGLPILTATLYLARAAAYAERARVRAFLGPSPRSPPTGRPRATVSGTGSSRPSATARPGRSSRTSGSSSPFSAS